MELQDSDRLCDICQALDLSATSFIVQPSDNESDFEEMHQLGNLRDVCMKTHCPLCRLVVQTTGGPFSEPYDDIERIKCEIYFQQEGSIATAEGFKVRVLCICASPWPPSFNELNRLVLVADDAPTPSPLFFGRLLKEDQVNFKLIKKWLRLCKTWHGRDCDRLIFKSKETPWQLPFFKVIDVWNQCVVDAPANCKYVALSYVWGSAKSFQATKTNISGLAKRGSLKENSRKIPLTIKDAMQLVSRLGERYLWVDSICIVQDESFAKLALIANMDLVYGHAFFTIIAACGDGADAGLSGVRRYSRAKMQTVENIMPGVRLMFAQHLTDELGKSVYKTRAWTHQERLFSRRCLIFTDAQVIFQCRAMCWREDIVAEDSTIDSCLDMHGAYMFDSFAVGHNSPYDDYIGSLYEFSRRKISFESDILNAFAGISKALAAGLDASMCYGIPNSVFDWALLWQPSQKLRRRSEFPSWSWAGWIGGVDWSLKPFTRLSSKELQDWLTMHTWIVWYQRGLRASEHTLVWTAGQTGGEQDDSVPSQPPGYQSSSAKYHYGRPLQALTRFSFSAQTSPIRPVQPRISTSNGDNTQNIPTSNRLLLFRTLSVKFHISVKNPQPRLRGEGLFLFDIIDSNGVMSGSVWLNEAWSYIVEETHKHEFLVLSDGKSNDLTDQRYKEAISQKQCLDLDQYHDKENCFDRGPEGSDTDEDVSTWNLYNIMLIQWRDGIAERVNVGQIYRRALQHAFPPGPQWKEILLG